MDKRIGTLIKFLLKSRLSTPLLVIYLITTFLAVAEFVYSFNAPLSIYKGDKFLLYYLLVAMIPMAFLTPTPNKADAFNVFSLPISTEKIYDYWFLFQFVYRLLFLGFISSVTTIDLSSPFYFPFMVEYSLTGATLSSVNMLGRKMRWVFYVFQLAEVLTLPFLSPAMLFAVSGGITLASAGIYMEYRSSYDPIEFLSSLFQEKKSDVAQDKIVTGEKGERALLINRIKNPQIVLTFNVSGQLKVIKPKINAKYVLFIVSGALGVVELVLSVLTRPTSLGFGLYYFIGLLFYIAIIFQTQWLVMGTLAFERPWIGAQALGVNRYFREVHLSNLLVLTMSWGLLGAFSAVASIFGGPKVFMIAVLSLPSSWLLYVILFLSVSSSMPNVQLIADENQPYMGNVRNVVGISFLSVIPFFVLLITSSLASVIPTITFIEMSGIEAIVVGVVAALALNNGAYNNYSLKVLSTKGYL
ncbi:hypothetical protein [Sulfuracidifex tepidarius]|uniref:Uncharacterized protein n=1 Tax=Sulfuracidifex tepidarius TaxID=1294262 RepID=A0A510E108_9CREN|nr:hypothetical protein [Sulfuracidifex tepidarius]BBG25788.1 hypothetical protein IC007_0293 [Sulfuracidifex tepidarius]